MKILGIETTCDETAVAVVESGKKILFHAIASQAEQHAQHGGVFPEMAARQHVDAILPLVEKAKKKVRIFDAVAVANGPGLVGSLLTGVMSAQALAYSWDLPLIGVNHVEAHLYAAMMGDKEPSRKLLFPALGLVLSGGHTLLTKIRAINSYTIIGKTVDDALGEAFDKVATLLGCPYPGGPQIEVLARKGDPDRYPFKPGFVKNRPFDFSFSGLKTNALYTIKGKNSRKSLADIISEGDRRDVAASFQKTAFLDVISKALKAAQTFPCRAIYLGGGVTNSQTLKSMFEEEASYPLYWPPERLSLDNGAMIAGLAFHIPKSGSLDLQVFPKMAFKSAIC